MIRALLLLSLLAGCAPVRQAARPAAPQALGRGAGGGRRLASPCSTTRPAGWRTLLDAAGTPAGDIHRLSASPDVLAQPSVQLASKARVLDAIAELQPAAGPGLPGVHHLARRARPGAVPGAAPRVPVSPAELDAALDRGCGTAPTVAVVSACYTGGFAQPPMARPDRIVLTAAAADRPSFGCGAGAELAFYDECLLRTLRERPQDWAAVAADTGRCVARLEAQDGETPSMPQTAIGAQAAGLPVPG